MAKDSIYGDWKEILPMIQKDIIARVEEYREEEKALTGIKVYEHFESRIKAEDSMREKCVRKGLPQTPHTALKELKDSIGVRIVCDFIDDVYRNISYIEKMEGVTILERKDYIHHAKENGYRSYHMILEVESDIEDVDGNEPGKYFVEVQIRTIAMDTWASLEHEMKYKKTIRNQRLIELELKRVADELASCDVSMQTIRELIRENAEE